MRVAFLGNAPWAVPSLEALAESSHEVSLVGTRTPRPAGGGKRGGPNPGAGGAQGGGPPPLGTGDPDGGGGGARLALLGAHVLVDTVGRLEAGSLEPVPQDEAAASYAPKVTAADRVIRWEAGPEEIVRQVRALAPEPSATTVFRGRLVKVFRAEEVDPSRLETVATGPPGAIAVASARGLAVAAGRGAVELVEVGPEGRRRMSGAEFVHGYRPKVGETLG